MGTQKVAVTKIPAEFLDSAYEECASLDGSWFAIKVLRVEFTITHDSHYRKDSDSVNNKLIMDLERTMLLHLISCVDFARMTSHIKQSYQTAPNRFVRLHPSGIQRRIYKGMETICHAPPLPSCAARAGLGRRSFSLHQGETACCWLFHA